MGKQGPCYHCGVTSTPLWRNGPPEKPVLCNACGSRWRTKGTLLNYTPLHVRAESVEIAGMSVNKKRKSYQEHLSVKRANLEASNRSSSGSNSESYAQSNAWDSTYPCKKRACLSSSVEKLTKDLCCILQEQQSSCLSGEDLLFENETTMVIGHGSVLMTDPPHSGVPAEESEASSLGSFPESELLHII